LNNPEPTLEQAVDALTDLIKTMTITINLASMAVEKLASENKTIIKEITEIKAQLWRL
jgi:FtsZ-binding cell division protein ZapB